MSDGKYFSFDIVNKLLEMMARHLLGCLLSEINEMEWFAVIADQPRIPVDQINYASEYDGLIEITQCMRM